MVSIKGRLDPILSPKGQWFPGRTAISQKGNRIFCHSQACDKETFSVAIEGVGGKEQVMGFPETAIMVVESGGSRLEWRLMKKCLHLVVRLYLTPPPSALPGVHIEIFDVNVQ